MKKYFLYPITYIFSIIVYIRNVLYNYKIFSITQSKIPIISIGNIQVGGTGKTPFVTSLSKLLQINNIRPLIITRGYKRNTSKQIIFTNINQYTVEEVGDEPYYFKKTLTEIPIIIDNNKIHAIQKANQLPNIDCIILDDGYQSRYIKRDLDIVLINTWHKKNNFWMMPSGNLREKISNLNRADLIYTTKGIKSKDLFSQYKTYHLDIDYQLTTYHENKLINFETIPNNKNKKIIAVSGIANPFHFLESLNKKNIHYDKSINLANHYQYEINAHPIQDDENIIYVTTYKDFFKLHLKKSTVYILDMRINLDEKLILKKIKKIIEYEAE
tara:strand:+ start:15398 stop:16381 length:984 start_codon:yes stop_codon:yes gene_type:complete